VIPGEKVNVMVPQGQFTPAGTMPRMRPFTAAGVLYSGPPPVSLLFRNKEISQLLRQAI